MVKPSKYEIAYTAMPVGEHVVEFDFNHALFVASPQSGIENGEGKITLTVIKHATMLEIEAHIVGWVELECDRCADLYRQPLDFSQTVVVKISEEQGEYDGDIIWIDPRTTTVDLTQWIYESVILSLPLQRVHLKREQCNAEALKYIQSQ